MVITDWDGILWLIPPWLERHPLSRKERANQVRKRDYFTQYGEQVRAVLAALLDKYADEGIEQIEALEVLKVPPFGELGTLLEILKWFGGKHKYLEAVARIEDRALQGILASGC